MHVTAKCGTVTQLLTVFGKPMGGSAQLIDTLLSMSNGNIIFHNKFMMWKDIFSGFAITRTHLNPKHLNTIIL